MGAHSSRVSVVIVVTPAAFVDVIVSVSPWTSYSQSDVTPHRTRNSGYDNVSRKPRARDFIRAGIGNEGVERRDQVFARSLAQLLLHHHEVGPGLGAWDEHDGVVTIGEEVKTRLGIGNRGGLIALYLGAFPHLPHALQRALSLGGDRQTQAQEQYGHGP